jgi:hypothetical protein
VLRVGAAGAVRAGLTTTGEDEEVSLSGKVALSVTT